MANKVSFIIIAQDRYSKVAASISRSTEKMNKKLTGLKTSLIGVNSRFSRLKHGLKSAGAQFTTLEKKIGKVGKKIRNFGLGMVASLTLPIGFMLNSFKNAARDAEESGTKFDAIFNDMVGGANNVANQFAKDFSLAGSTSRELLGNTADLLTGFGFAQDAALGLSVKVNELAVDLASFKNFSGGAEGASAALTKALLGERESLKSLGVAILEKDVQTKVSQLLSQGMRFDTMRQAKAVATLQLALEQSKNAIGDHKNTLAGLANQERKTSEQFKMLREQLGNLLLPIFLKLNHIVQKLIGKFLQLSPRTQKIILVIAALVAVLGPLVLIVGTFMVMLPAIIAGFSALGVAVTTVIWPLALLVAAFAAGWWIGKKLANLLRDQPKLWNAIGATVYGVLHPTEGVKMLWEQITNLVSPLTNKLREMPGLWNAIGATINAILHPIDSLKLAFEKIMEFTTNLRGFLTEMAGGALDKLLSLGGGGFKGQVESNSRTTSDINVGITAPPGVVQKVNTKTRGSSQANIGVNMQESLQ